MITADRPSIVESVRFSFIQPWICSGDHLFSINISIKSHVLLSIRWLMFPAVVLSPWAYLFVSVTTFATVPLHFSTNYRFVNTDNLIYFRLIMSCFKQRINFVSLRQRKLAVVSHLCSLILIGKKREKPPAAALS